MIIAGVIIQTLPGRASDVGARLAGIPSLTLHGGDGNSRIAAVWNAPDGFSLQELAEALVDTDEEIVGVYPTFVGEDGE